MRNNNGMRGTIRWMAPEMMPPAGCGFTKECRIRLPSKGTDIYSLGMTILEVRFFLESSSPTENPGTFRLSRDVIHFPKLLRLRKLCSKFSQESDRIDHMQFSRNGSIVGIIDDDVAFWGGSDTSTKH